MERQEKLYFYNLTVDFIQYSKDPAFWNLYLLNKENAIQFRKYDAVKLLKAVSQKGYIESLNKTEEEVSNFIYFNGPQALKELIVSGSVVVALTSKNDVFSPKLDGVVGLTKLNSDGTADKNLFTDILCLGQEQGSKKESSKIL